MKIICIGRNYTEHARELNNPLPGKPVFFIKPDTALLLRNKPFQYPEFSRNIHYETELVLRISCDGKNIDEDLAAGYYHEIGLGIDFTARDLQDDCKKKGLPWEISKAFDHSAVVSRFLRIDKLKNSSAIFFTLKLNGKLVQKGCSSDMIFSFPRIVSYVSKFITLRKGDLFFTGTPEGVGPVDRGDRLTADLEGTSMLDFMIR
ncbi:MAG: fumarylacetoacetate hydrolase family protein [Bacteroidales bacterium]|nr:fumarylacetoacetate hydrolase family protein [Bacteroidales bacterium]